MSISLKDQIISDLKESLKTGDSFKRDVLRLLSSMIKNSEIEKKKKEVGLNDQEVIEIIKKSIKQRKDSIEQYEKGNRPDLVDKEEKEIEVISDYLPVQMDEDKVREEIKKLISGLGEVSPKDFGKIMGISMKKLQGQADGNVVKKILEEELSKK